MRKRKWAILAAATLLFASLLTYALRATHEPTYAGRPISYWVLQYDRASDDTKVPGLQAARALDAAGTNAIPYLLKWITYETPAWRYQVLRYLARIPYTLRSWIDSPARLRLADATPIVFGRLESTAPPAIPVLSQLASAPDKPDTAQRAVHALSAIGTNGIPALLQIIAIPNHPQRPTAAFVITYTILRSPDCARLQQLVLPHLLRCLTDNQGEASNAAAGALGHFQHEAEHVVPALVNCLQSTNRDIKSTAINSLGQLGSNAVAAIPALCNFLMESKSLVSDQLEFALNAIAPTVYTNVPVPFSVLPPPQTPSPPR